MKIRKTSGGIGGRTNYLSQLLIFVAILRQIGDTLLKESQLSIFFHRIKTSNVAILSNISIRITELFEPKALLCYF